MLQRCRPGPVDEEYNLFALAADGEVAVGRDPQSTITLDCPELPLLTSRRHAIIKLTEDGLVTVKDLNSTNGTYAARKGDSLKRLEQGTAWILKSDDRLAFGGHEYIHTTGGRHVPNPFMFTFRAILESPASLSFSRTEDFVCARASLLSAALQDQRQLGGLAPVPQPSRLLPQEPGQSKRPEHQVPPLVQQVSADYDQPEKENIPKDGTAAGSVSNPGMTEELSYLSSHFSCAICHDWLLATHIMPCGHFFCGLCLAGWLELKRNCPTCRKPVTVLPVRCVQLDETIATIVAHQPQFSTIELDERRRRQMEWDSCSKGVQRDWAAMFQPKPSTSSDSRQCIRSDRSVHAQVQRLQHPLLAPRR